MITVLVPYDQLHRNHGALAGADPSTHEILMIESQGMLASRTWHAQRLQLLLSAAAHFAQELRAEGFVVHTCSAASVADGITAFRARHAGAEIIATAPRSRPLMHALRALDVPLTEDDSFLTSRADFAQWANGRRKLTMEPFYRWQRERLGYLMDGADPIGGTWNFDAENRLPPPKGDHAWPTPPRYEPDAIDLAVQLRITGGEFPVTGDTRLGTWGTTRAHALTHLNWFIQEAFEQFGPYEDAMPSDTWSVNHSLLSPYLNIGLLTPREVCDAAAARFAAGGIPLPSAEGFIRQMIGWREYVNGVYWTFPADYEALNVLNASGPLLPLFEDPTCTDMACMHQTLSDTWQRGWNHHIPRLMLMANLAMLTDTDPQVFLDWMRRMFIDAADWVMVPNVIGMGVHADGGQMMTKPYAAGGAYIKRMGAFCGACRFNPTKRVGDDACPFTSLYWDFLAEHEQAFRGNHRMAQQLASLRKLADLPAVRERAAQVRAHLAAGTL